MFTRLRIRNLRGFDDLQIDKLSRINLVAGKNNVGKSTLLEAIHLLASAGDSRIAASSSIARTERNSPMGTSIAESNWKMLFSELDTSRALRISGDHTTIGHMEQTIAWVTPVTAEIRLDGGKGDRAKALSGGAGLKFRYTDPTAGVIETEAREGEDSILVKMARTYAPFMATILQPGAGDVTEDANRLGRLRKQKRGNWLLDALQVVDDRLRGIEENSSGGRSMIWVDIGLSELVPLPVMGAGMIHFTRIVLALALAPGGVVLIDEIENGLHHSVLAEVWGAIAKTAEQFNVQIFATTHSFECVEAAQEALGAGGFRLHRLEVVDGATRCVTYGHDAMDGAIRHNLEFR